MPEIFPGTIPAEQDFRPDPEPLVREAGAPRAGTSYRTVLAGSYLVEEAFLENPVAPTAAETERMLEMLGWRDDALVGVRYAVTLVERPDGRRSVISTVQRRVLARRASGKVFTRWAQSLRGSLAWTSKGLLVKTTRSADGGGYSSDGVTGSSRVWDLEADALAMDVVRDLLRSIGRVTNDIVRQTNGGECHRRPEIVVQQLSSRSDAPSRKVVNALVDTIASWIGDAPSAAERFPLWEGRSQLLELPAFESDPWLDAQDFRQVAANAFGKTRVTRPLVRAVEKCTPSAIAWYRLFRGLVPMEAIVASMEAEVSSGTMSIWNGGLTSHSATTIRSILVRVPETVLKRVLKEPRGTSLRALTDAATALANPKIGRHKDLDELPELITARGQRNVRGAADLEHLVRALPEKFSEGVRRSTATMQVLDREQRWRRELDDYNALLRERDEAELDWVDWQDEAVREAAGMLTEEARRARMREEEREREEAAERRRLKRLKQESERAAWCSSLTGRLHGKTWTAPDGTTLKAIVADSPKLLRLWGETMGNCIGSYGSSIGLDLLVGIVDASTDKLLLNAQVTRQGGVEQLLGKGNRDAVDAVGQELAQSALDRLLSLGAKASLDGWGLRGLRTELTPVSA